MIDLSKSALDVFLQHTKWCSKSDTFPCDCGKDEAENELDALREQVRAKDEVLMIYANEQNWKSINGLMVLQTLDHPWNPALAALKGADNA